MSFKKDARGFASAALLLVFTLVGGVSYISWYDNYLKFQPTNEADTTVRIEKNTKKSSEKVTQTSSPVVTKTPLSNPLSSATQPATTPVVPTPPVSNPNPDPNPDPNVPADNFNIEDFYAAIEIGMTYSQVQTMANGQPGSCAMTASLDSGSICSWHKDNKVVYVSFSVDSYVTGKSKSGF